MSQHSSDSPRTVKDRILAALSRERIICRVIAAWTVFAAVSLLFGDGNYSVLSFGQDASLSSMAIAIVLMFLLFTAVSALLPRFETDTWFLLLGATACALNWLQNYEGKKESFLVTLAVMVAYGLFVFYFVHRNGALFGLLKPGNRTVMIAACVLGLAGGAIIAIITCLRYLTFSTPNFDFGLFVNMFHNMKETGLPNVTCERNELLSHFAVHISPIYYVLLPFYFIFPSPLTLQIGQAVALASGVIPVFLLARHKGLSGKMQIAVAAIYAFYPAISAGCFYDIHENCFLAPLLLWMFYFYEREKYLWMYVFAFGVLMVKEDAAMYVIMFALFVLLSKHEKKRKLLHGGALVLGALAYFALALFLLTKFGDGVMVNRFDNLIYNKDDGLLGAVKTALQNPGFLLTQLFTTKGDTWDKLIYIFQMFLPLGFLPFVTKKPSRWLLMAPMLMNLLTYYQYQYDIGFQYNFGVTAFLMYAMILNLPDLKAPTRKNLVTWGAVACLCLYTVTVIPKLTSYADRWENGKGTYTKMEEILDTLPEDASLNVSSFLLAHVADRDEIYQAKYGSLYHGSEPDVDYVVLDIRGVNMTKDYSSTKESERPETVRLRDDYLAHGYTVYEHEYSDNADYDGLILILQSPAVTE